MLSDGLVEIHTNVGVQRAGAVRAPRGSAPLRVGWGRPTIVGIEPPFGPQDGGTTVTIVGNFFSDETVTQRLRKVVLTHSGDGGEARECCATARLSETQMSCRLPRVSCLSSNPTKPCPQPGLSFANQTVIYAIQPDVKGYDGSVPANELDDFVQFEGTWELDDEDVYGGLYVDTANRIDGQQYILNTPISQATQKCCPVCATPGSASCWFTITQATTDSGSPRPGVYTVKVPEFMRPSGQAGPCDASTNFVNTSLTMGIELSTDPRGFTPTPPLSITSCIDMTGPCAQLPRASIRETCKQLMWSTGSISATLPVGQTVEVYTWVADGVCDRRMKCVAGPCLWTSLVNTSEDGQPKLLRRASSAQIGLEVAYPNPGFDPAGFLAALSEVVLPTSTPTLSDPQRLQELEVLQSSELPLSILGTTFAVREAFQLQPASLCVPDAGYSACTPYSLIIYIVSGGPGTLGSEVTAQDSLYALASNPTGDPRLRMLV